MNIYYIYKYITYKLMYPYLIQYNKKIHSYLFKNSLLSVFMLTFKVGS